jgi:hypothetical protein
MTESERQALLDHEHLRLLRIGYFIAGSINAFWVFFPLIYVAMGAFVAFGGIDTPNSEARSVGIMFIAIGLGISFIFAVAALLKFLTARAIGRRSSRTLCLITAAVTCLGIPYGTALGVATLIVLSRPSVLAAFESADRTRTPVSSPASQLTPPPS